MKAKELLDKYKTDTCTPEERALVESWYLVMPQEGIEPSYTEIEGTKTQVWASLSPENKAIKSLVWSSPFIKAAAAILLVLGAGWWFSSKQILRHVQNGDHILSLFKHHDLAPGGNRAILTLANGKKINLTNVKNGNLANENNIAISKTADGQIVYTSHGPAKNHNPENASFNTITTPRGGRYTLMLSDGTEVILNAASSLKYPAYFKGRERTVELTGEAYFIVKHNAKQPFRVESRGQIVEDIGTEFNINSYNDEPFIKTTLIEGAAKVNTVLLQPGQQSSLTANGSIKVAAADIEEVLAWKEGYFLFRGEKLESVMRKIAYWYDVNVIYACQKPMDGFRGKISRNRKISSVLEMLELTGAVHFKIEGRNVIVLN